MTIYLIMTGSRYSSDNDRIYGYVTSKEKAESIVKEKIENQYGHHYFYLEVNEHD